MAPKSAAPASSSSYASSSGDEEAEEQPITSAPSSSKAPMPSPAPKSNLSKSPKPKPPPSSTEEDDSSGTEDEEDSNQRKPSPLPNPPTKPTTADSDSTDDSDSEPAPSKPIKTPAPKRKTPEKASENGAGEKKKPLFQRIWNTEDEIVILRGILEYNAKKGTMPYSSTDKDKDAFHDFIHKSLRTEVTKSQLYEKVRRLKKKYGTAAQSENPSLAKHHDAAAYELSQKIWGSNKIILKDKETANEDGSSMKKKKQRRTKDGDTGGLMNIITVADNEGADSAKLGVRYPFLLDAISQIGGYFPSSIGVKELLALVDDSKAMALEEKHKKLWKVQAKTHLRQMDLTKETKKTVMEALSKLG